jgi:arylesterase/paraoxonase
MKAAIKTAFGQEMSLARDAYERDQLDEAFRLLERAHILGQRYFTTHFITHWWMLKVGIRKTDWREIRGQILRIIAVIPGYLFGWVPKGNTGGADVSALKPMPIPDDLATPLKGYNVWTDVLLRVLVWPVVALLVWFGMFAWSTYVRAGETRNIVSAFDGTCSPLVGFEGPEDLVWDREAGTVYAVGGDRRSFRSGGPGRAKIWSLPMASPDLAVPNDLAPAQPEIFRSFGMDLHIDEMGTRRLFVANRPSDGHTIEVFRVTASGDLLLERTLKHPLLRNPNDLVAIGPTEALVTLDKKADAATLGEIFEGARQLRTGKVLRINTETAEYVAEDLWMANGIAFSPSQRVLYVGETIAQRLSVFDYDPQTKTLFFNRHVPLETGVDNITVNPDGRVFIAGHPKLLTLAMGYQRSETSPSPSEVLVYDPSREAVERLYVNDGSEHSGGSVAIVDDASGRMLIGSAFGPHILSCEFGHAANAAL